MNEPKDTPSEAVETCVDESPCQGPLGDVLPGKGPDPRTRGGQRQEDVSDRPTVGTVKPEDYPEDQRAKGA
jgi:hypothetical protein